jgi:hypothetical protein
MLSTMFISIQSLCEKILLKIILFFSILQYYVTCIILFMHIPIPEKWINNMSNHTVFYKHVPYK